MANKKSWLQILAHVTGSINQELLLRNDYLVAENRILKSHIKGRLLLSDGERVTVGLAKSHRAGMSYAESYHYPGIDCAIATGLHAASYRRLGSALGPILLHTCPCWAPEWLQKFQAARRSYR